MEGADVGLPPFPAVSGDPDARGLTEGGEAVDAAQGEGGLDVLSVKAAGGQSGHSDRLVGMDGIDRPLDPGNQALQVGPVMGLARGQARASLSRRPVPPVARQPAITSSYQRPFALTLEGLCMRLRR